MGHFNIGRDHQDKNSFVLICSDPSLQEEKIPHHFGELRPQDFPLVCPSMFLNKMTSKTICVIFISVHIILKMMHIWFSRSVFLLTINCGNLITSLLLALKHLKKIILQSWSSKSTVSNEMEIAFKPFFYSTAWFVLPQTNR